MIAPHLQHNLAKAPPNSNLEHQAHSNPSTQAQANPTQPSLRTRPRPHNRLPPHDAQLPPPPQPQPLHADPKRAADAPPAHQGARTLRARRAHRCQIDPAHLDRVRGASGRPERLLEPEPRRTLLGVADAAAAVEPPDHLRPALVEPAVHAADADHDHRHADGAAELAHRRRRPLPRPPRHPLRPLYQPPPQQQQQQQ
ncbi:hypothetical protein GJ744_010326 [Endocarpon pusillum]|uniref:Uncharacterized protein n=1 Tax=Endocarpon pusillum TaxID=364733 RepID=A0A8H7E3Q2_9EURO|nr:hypothetical protein GJ744_010326 [Endocarpon pusillum]